MHKGAILGKETGKPCALSIIASRRDLICVRQKLAGINDHQWDYYRIGTFYELISMDLPNRCLSRGEIRIHLENTDLREPHQMEFSETDLQRFFSQKHPEWLSEIASTQLEHWKRYKPGKYFLFAAIEAVEIPLCIRVAPYAALSRFSHLLTQKQLTRCVLRSPNGAVIHAFDEIPSEKRRSYLLRYPNEALLYSLNKLTDADLSICAVLEMKTAFRLRVTMPPERRALVLSHSLMIASIGLTGDQLALLQMEIKTSITEHPAQWLASDVNGFPSIFQSLEEFVDMRIDPLIVTSLLRNTGSLDKQSLADFISQKI